MSSCPGYKLEAYLRWCYNIRVDDTPDANTSLGIAEAMGTAINFRPCLTTEQFNVLLEMFEHHRDRVEDVLANFDDDTMSWRDYAGYSFGFIDDSVDTQGLAYVRQFSLV